MTTTENTERTYDIEEMLSYRRSHLSLGEQEFIERYLHPLIEDPSLEHHADEFGNLLIVIRSEDVTEPSCVFTAHTDTCHSGDNERTRQELEVSNRVLRLANRGPKKQRKQTTKQKQKKQEKEVEKSIFAKFLEKKGTAAKPRVKLPPAKAVPHEVVSEVLGADDGTGIYIMLNMIEEGIVGKYLFTRGEEVGCLGSHHIVDTADTNVIYAALNLERVGFMLSFDRKGQQDIITDMVNGECCSDMVAGVLSSKIAEASDYFIMMKADPTGSVTDSASFDGLVPHYSNLSVGYNRQHTSAETQDLDFLDLLMSALLLVDWEHVGYMATVLPEPEKSSWYGSGQSYNAYGVGKSVKDPYRVIGGGSGTSKGRNSGLYDDEGNYESDRYWERWHDQGNTIGDTATVDNIVDQATLEYVQFDRTTELDELIMANPFCAACVHYAMAHKDHTACSVCGEMQGMLVDLETLETLSQEEDGDEPETTAELMRLSCDSSAEVLM